MKTETSSTRDSSTRFYYCNDYTNISVSYRGLLFDKRLKNAYESTMSMFSSGFHITVNYRYYLRFNLSVKQNIMAIGALF